MNTYKPQEFAEMIGGIHMSHVITMDNVRQLNVFSFSKKDNSPRGYQTVGIEELQLGDKIIIGNYFTTIVEGEN